MKKNHRIESPYNLIEDMTEQQAASIAEEIVNIKGHTVYLGDVGNLDHSCDYLGFSALVFLNGHHVYFADEHEVHYHFMDYSQDPPRQTEPTREYLRQRYIEKLNNKLYTEAEITGPVKDYDDYQVKDYYLRNYYPMQEDYITVFFINPTPEQEREFKRRTASMTYSPISFGYFPRAEFVRHQMELHKALEAQYQKTMQSPEEMKKAFLKEMYNHEYGINWQADYDVLSAFGRIEYSRSGENELEDYFQQLDFTAEQKAAYIAARREYYRTADL